MEEASRRSAPELIDVRASEIFQEEEDVDGDAVDTVIEGVVKVCAERPPDATTPVGANKEIDPEGVAS